MHGVVFKCSQKLRWWGRFKLIFHETSQQWSLWCWREHGGGRFREHMMEEITPELCPASAACCMQLLSLQSHPDVSSLPLNRSVIRATLLGTQQTLDSWQVSQPTRHMPLKTEWRIANPYLCISETGFKSAGTQTKLNISARMKRIRVLISIRNHFHIHMTMIISRKSQGISKLRLPLNFWFSSNGNLR